MSNSVTAGSIVKFNMPLSREEKFSGKSIPLDAGTKVFKVEAMVDGKPYGVELTNINNAAIDNTGKQRELDILI
ncbi:MAG TPA: hypothetical protein DDW90_05780 [Cyanobacteria bacterium UBA9971]|nr:hypothetical protein [Cyanobacteria bacterium UBA9971]